MSHQANAAISQRFTPWWKFFLLAAALTILFVSAWRQVAGPMASPAAVMADWVLETAFDDSWLYRARLTAPTTLELDTRLKMTTVAQPDGTVLYLPPGQWAEISAEVDPSRYGYGLPILLALLVAARTKHWLRKSLLGAALLVPFQAFSTAMLAVKEVAFLPGVAQQLAYQPWQLELIAFGYQFGVLVVPTMAPVVLWLIMDSRARAEWGLKFPTPTGRCD